MAWYKKSLKSKIMLPTLFVVFLMLFVIVYSVAVYGRLLVEGFTHTRLDAARPSVTNFLDEKAQQGRITASAMGGSAELIGHINAGDRNAVLQYAIRQKNFSGVDAIIVIDANGTTIARSHVPDFYGDDVSGVPGPAAGLRGERVSFYATTPTVPFVLTSTSPIMDGDRLIGAVVANFDVGENRFLDDLSAKFGVSLTAFVGDTSVASTLIHPDTGDRAVGTNAAPHISEAVVTRGEHITVDLNIFGRLPYVAYYFPLRGVDNQIIGMFFVGMSQSDAAAAVAQIRYVLISIGVVGLLGIAVAMFVLISKTLKPLTALERNVIEVAKGNFNVNFNTVGSDPDEIGVLENGVNVLVGSVRKISDGLATMINEHVVNGEVDYRLNEEGYEGAYLELVKAVNEFADANGNDIDILFSVMNAISQGDFNMKLEKMPGKKIAMNEIVDLLFEDLQLVSRQLTDAADSFKEGRTPQLDVGKLEGGWKQMVESLQVLSDAVSKPLQEVMDVMKRISEGYGDVKVDGEYKGNFLTLKNSVNHTVDILTVVIDDVIDTLAALSEGDLTKEINKTYPGEFAYLKDSINAISRKLNRTMEDIDMVANGVAGGADMLSKSSQALSMGVQEQMASIEELSAGVTDIDDQSKDNAENSQKAAELAKTSRTNAVNGNEEMKQLLESMSKITTSSNKISQIIKTIESIAFQTNLLALNAAVEAARAGEHGKGFAVVAEEVRSLAARSADAAKQTNDLIQESIESVEEGMSRANDTASSLDKIVDNVVNVEDVIGKIYDSSMRQTHAIHNINSGLGQIGNVVQSDASTSEETAAAAEELNAQVDILKEKLAYFRLSSSISTAAAMTKMFEGASISTAAISSLNTAVGKKVTYERGDVIVREGDTASNSMFFVLEGSADIIKHNGTLNQQILHILKPGDHFGEVGLFLQEPRTATVIAKDRIQLLEVSGSDMQQFMSSNPDVSYTMVKTLGSRIHEMFKAMGL